MNRFAQIVVISTMCMIAMSCIRESLPPCPSLSISLTVKDKNYFNIDDAVKLGLMERKADSLPFREYIHSLYYILHNEAGQVIVEQRNIQIENDDQTLNINIPTTLPYGKYTLTAWGNMDGEESLGENASQAGMESAGTATNDIYLGCKTFDYQYGAENHTLELERTKGNLLIKAEGLPDNIDFSTKNIDGVYGVVDNGFTYSKPTNVQTELDWTVQNDIQTQTLMCPSESFEGSALNLVFLTNRNSTLLLEQHSILLSLRRI